MAFCGVNAASRYCSSHLLHVNVVCVPVRPGGQVAVSVEFSSLSLFPTEIGLRNIFSAVEKKVSALSTFSAC